MAKLGINTGSTPNDGTGDSLLSGAIKVNSNFDEIYSALGDGSTITNSIDFAVIAGYSTASGIATYASNAGIATLANYATSAGIATNASTATYAVNAGFSTGAATADGLAGTPNITVGFVTASYLSGDGGNITGIVTNLTAGNGISLSNNGGTVNVSNNKSDDYPSKWVQTGSGIHTMANVGIGTTTPLVDLHINNSQVKLTDSSSISLDDNNKIHFGSSGTSDSSMFWNGTDLILKTSSKLTIKDSNNLIFEAIAAEGPILYYDGIEKLQVQSDSVLFSADVNVTGDIYTSGVCTAVAFHGQGSSITGIVTSLVAGTNVTISNTGGTYTINSSGGAVSTLTGLNDVTLTSPSNGDVLKYDGNGWINDTTAGTYGNSDVDSHLNVSGALTGQILSWNGSDYAWVADQTGGGGSSYANSDVDTHLNVSGATSGQILSWNGSDYAWVADQTGGGGGGRNPRNYMDFDSKWFITYQFAGDGFPTAQNDPHYIL